MKYSPEHTDSRMVGRKAVLVLRVLQQQSVQRAIF